MTVAAHIPYLLTTLKGTNKPHIFTWVIWSLLTFIAFAAQVAGGAGPGAWVTGATGIICVIITAAALRTGRARHHAQRLGDVSGGVLPRFRVAGDGRSVLVGPDCRRHRLLGLLADLSQVIGQAA